MSSSHLFFFRSICLLLLISLSACRSENAKVPTYQFLNVYTDVKGEMDDEIIKKFEKETGIDVHFHILTIDSLLHKLNFEKYSSSVDVVLFSNSSDINKLNKFLGKLDEKVFENIDSTYIPNNNKWLVLAKSPLVLCGNKTLLLDKQVKYFSDLKDFFWKGKLSVSEYGNASIDVFEKSYREMKIKDIDSFFVHFYLNRTVVKGGDEQQLNLLQKGFKTIGLIELKNFISYESNLKLDSLNKKEFANLQVILPAQNKKGTIYNVFGGGIYKYAENKSNAFQFLSFLSSNRAQYKFAAGRNVYPIIQEIDVNYHLQKFKRIRARFYKSAFE